jgi:hypothetical protein
VKGAATVAVGACPAAGSDAVASANTVYYKIPCLPAGYAIKVTNRMDPSSYSLSVTGFSDGGTFTCGAGFCSCTPDIVGEQDCRR